MSAQAYIVDALRSPTGKRKGSLATVHGADLGAHVIKALVERNDIPAADYDDVIFGCVDTIGALAGDIARTSWLAAGMPLNVPGTTIDRQCGSSQQAVHFAALDAFPRKCVLVSSMAAAEPIADAEPMADGRRKAVRALVAQPPGTHLRRAGCQ